MAFILTDMLTGVLAEGTAEKAGPILHRPAAGKSGTSHAGINAHMIGYTPELLAGLYIGDDFEQPLGTTERAGSPLWPSSWRMPWRERPLGIPSHRGSPKTICPHSGLLQSPNCKARKEEYFIAGTAPTEECSFLTCPLPS